MFVTLQLCQLTQPYGSLLFQGASGFLWRCNPIASFVESCIIAVELVRSFWGVCMEARRRRNRRLEPMKWKVELKRQLCDKASGILLLRGAVGDDMDNELLEELMTASFLDRDESLLPATSPAEGTSTAVSGSSTESPGELQGPSAIIALQPLARADLPPVETSAELLEVPPADTSTLPQQGVQRRSTTNLETGPRSSSPIRIQTQPSSDLKSEKSRLLSAAFGSNALAHREYRIDIVAVVSIVLIFVKLFFIRGAYWFTAAASLMTLGWITVQLLLILFHIRDMGESEMASSVRVARILNAELNAKTTGWQAIYVIMHLPFLGYLSYLFAFRFTFPRGLHWLGWFLQHLLAFIAAIVSRLCGTAFVGCVFGGILFLSANYFVALMLLFIGAPLSIYLFFANWTYSQKVWPSPKYNNGTDEYVPLFTNPTLDMLVDTAYRNTITGVWLLMVLALLTTVFCALLCWQDEDSLSGRRNLRKRVSIGNAVIAVGMFLWYILTYDPSHTSKPDALDWLG